SFFCSAAHRALHSFPTRRSSDLDQQAFLKKVDETVKKVGYCVIVVSEGARTADGTFLADAGTTDAFGHKQLGGVAPVLAQMVKKDRKSTRLNSSHVKISYAVFCL